MQSHTFDFQADGMARAHSCPIERFIKFYLIQDVVPKKVLIVDDESSITGRMSEIAFREGYHPLTASNGVEALDILKAGSVDLLLTDASLPKMRGEDLIKIIKGRYVFQREEIAQNYFGGNLQEYDAFVQAHKSTPAIIMSKDPDIVGETAKNIWALGCFPKSYDKSQPFDEAQLVQTLRKYLSE